MSQSASPSPASCSAGPRCRRSSLCGTGPASRSSPSSPASRPTPWPGTALERFEIDSNSRAGEDTEWDSEIVVASAQGVIAADEANRIIAISRPLAALLGWDPAELTGRRVVTVIPPSLREAHVAGFSRHLTTGEAHVLGIPLVLPVLRKDGSEVRCRFLVDRRSTTFDHAVYLAWLDAVIEQDV